MFNKIKIKLALKKLLEDNEDLRLEAIKRLENLLSPPLPKTFIDVLFDDSTEVRVQVISSLGRLDDKSAILPLITTLADPSPRIRIIAAEALSLLGEKKWFNAVDGTDQDFVKILKLYDIRFLPSIIKQIPNINSSITCSLIEGLSGYSDDRIIEPIKYALFSKDRSLVNSAKIALSKLNDMAIIKNLLAHFSEDYDSLMYFLSNGTEKVKLVSLDILASFKSHSIENILIDLAENGETKNLRCHAINILGQIGHKEAIAKLMSLYTDSDREIRTAAVDALYKLLDHDPGMIPTFMKNTQGWLELLSVSVIDSYEPWIPELGNKFVCVIIFLQNMKSRIVDFNVNEVNVYLESGRIANPIAVIPCLSSEFRDIDFHPMITTIPALYTKFSQTDEAKVDSYGLLFSIGIHEIPVSISTSFFDKEPLIRAREIKVRTAWAYSGFSVKYLEPSLIYDNLPYSFKESCLANFTLLNSSETKNVLAVGPGPKGAFCSSMSSLESNTICIIIRIDKKILKDEDELIATSIQAHLKGGKKYDAFGLVMKFRFRSYDEPPDGQVVVINKASLGSRGEKALLGEGTAFYVRGYTGPITVVNGYEYKLAIVFPEDIEYNNITHFTINDIHIDWNRVPAKA